jgi:hypothetical protein
MGYENLKPPLERIKMVSGFIAAHGQDGKHPDTDKGWDKQQYEPKLCTIAAATEAEQNGENAHSGTRLKPVSRLLHHLPAKVVRKYRRQPVARTAPSGAVLDRRCVRAGMEEWLRQGPNKRMAPNRRAKCRQTRYPDPKPSTLHETGASPA